MRPPGRLPGWLIGVLVGAFAGLVFAGVSTYDFMQHLDRQVHSLHCSFIPGAGASAGASGCQAAMMSPYSSVLRTSIWGGIPISLPAMAVFAFLLFYGIDLVLTRRKHDPRATGFLALACALPALTSIVMLTISLTKLGTICKLCVGVYLASALCLIGAIIGWRRAVRERAQPIGTAKNGASLELAVDAPATSHGMLGAMFGVGVAFVAVPVLLYVAMAPDHGRFIGTCGQLEKPADTYGVMVPVARGGKTPAIEILDPLCPACKAFEQRLDASGLAGSLDRRAIMFPLDTTCNWMITENTHPGACTVSEAVLCAGDKAPEVLAWAFAVQDRVRAETKADPGAAARIVKERFPELAACVGSPEAKSRLNKSLRWAIANNIRVLTPQLFVDGVKLCDEDVDIGLDYVLARMIDGQAAAVRSAKPVESTPPSSMPTYQTKQPEPAKPAGEPAAESKPAVEPNPSDPVTSPSQLPSALDAEKPAPEKPAPEKPASPPASADQPAVPSEVPAAPALPPEEKPAEEAGGSQGGTQ